MGPPPASFDPPRSGPNSGLSNDDDPWQGAMSVSGQPTRARRATPAGLADVRTVEHDDRWLISVSGELDITTTWLLDHALAKAQAESSPLIVVDLRRVTFMDLSALDVLLAASGRAQADSHRLAVLRAPPVVHRLFELTGTEALVPFVDD
jgi:anti-anti-sigma factor